VFVDNVRWATKYPVLATVIDKYWPKRRKQSGSKRFGESREIPLP